MFSDLNVVISKLCLYHENDVIIKLLTYLTQDWHVIPLMKIVEPSDINDALNLSAILSMKDTRSSHESRSGL